MTVEQSARCMTWETCPSAALSTRSPTWSDLGSNPGRRSVHHSTAWLRPSQAVCGMAVVLWVMIRCDFTGGHQRSVRTSYPLFRAEVILLIIYQATRPHDPQRYNLSFHRCGIIKSHTFNIKFRNPMILSVLRHIQNPLEASWIRLFNLQGRGLYCSKLSWCSATSCHLIMSL
jgi:hypothetical protein